jgi:putative FmdB family regulatory protein
VPTYQYACTACGHKLEAVQAFTDEPLAECPACAGRLRKLFSSVGIVFKGSGFYRTDSRAAAEKSEGAADKKPTPVPAGATADGSKSEGPKSDGSKSEGSKSEGSRSEGSKSEGSRSEGSKSDGPKSEGARSGAKSERGGSGAATGSSASTGKVPTPA